MNRNQILKSLRSSEKMLYVGHTEYIEHYQQTIHAVENAVAFYLGNNIISHEVQALVFPNDKSTLTSEEHLTHLPFPQIYLYGAIAPTERRCSVHFEILIQKKTDFWKQREVPIPGERLFDFTITTFKTEFEYANYVPKTPIVAMAPFVAMPGIRESDRSLISRHVAINTEFSQYIEKGSQCVNTSLVNEIIVYYFLKLLSCKNIITKDEYAGNPNKKKRISELEYKTIHIQVPGNKYVYQDKEYESIPFHDREKFGMTGQKRGHFKTYTEEKPLFGRHTGTWWWSPMFDTSRKRDYEIKRI